MESLAEKTLECHKLIKLFLLWDDKLNEKTGFIALYKAAGKPVFCYLVAVVITSQQRILIEG